MVTKTFTQFNSFQRLTVSFFQYLLLIVAIHGFYHCSALYLYKVLRHKRVIMRLLTRYRDVLRVNWHVGFTAFGGPAVQFQTVRNINSPGKLSG